MRRSRRTTDRVRGELTISSVCIEQMDQSTITIKVPEGGSARAMRADLRKLRESAPSLLKYAHEKFISQRSGDDPPLDPIPDATFVGRAAEPTHHAPHPAGITISEREWDDALGFGEEDRLRTAEANPDWYLSLW
jgi:hypothetical protein